MPGPKHLGYLKAVWRDLFGRRDVALELVSGYDFLCKLMSRGSPGDLGGSRDRFRSKTKENRPEKIVRQIALRLPGLPEIFGNFSTASQARIKNAKGCCVDSVTVYFKEQAASEDDLVLEASPLRKKLQALFEGCPLTNILSEDRFAHARNRTSVSSHLGRPLGAQCSAELNKKTVGSRPAPRQPFKMLQDAGSWDSRAELDQSRHSGPPLETRFIDGIRAVAPHCSLTDARLLSIVLVPCVATRFAERLTPPA